MGKRSLCWQGVLQAKDNVVREEKRDRIAADMRCHKPICYNVIHSIPMNVCGSSSVPVGEVVTADVVK